MAIKQGTAKSRTLIDKTSWPVRGEWDNEPDEVQWIDEATDLPCLAVRSRSASWCGYVGVTEGHPLYLKHYRSVDVDVHGGLTFSGHGQAFLDHPENVWWLGFDCAHFGDYRPPTTQAIYDFELTLEEDNQYRNLAYVQWQCAELARQLAELATVHQ